MSKTPSNLDFTTMGSAEVHRLLESIQSNNLQRIRDERNDKSKIKKLTAMLTVTILLFLINVVVDLLTRIPKVNT